MCRTFPEWTSLCPHCASPPWRSPSCCARSLPARNPNTWTNRKDAEDLKRLLAKVLHFIQDLLMIHPVSGFIVGVYWIFIANFLRPGSLLVHVSSTDQFCTEIPAFPPGKLHVQSHVVVGFLNGENNTLFLHLLNIFFETYCSREWFCCLTFK